MSNDHSDAIMAISALDAAWGEAVARRDLDALVALYDPDGTLVWPGTPAVRGADGIRAAYADMLKIPSLGLTFTPETITVSEAGDMASDFGRVTMVSAETPGGPTTTAVAKYVVVWTLVGGQWKVLYDSWNSNEGA